MVGKNIMNATMGSPIFTTPCHGILMTTIEIEEFLGIGGLLKGGGAVGNMELTCGMKRVGLIKGVILFPQL
jgi:hypothetical protein